MPNQARTSLEESIASSPAQSSIILQGVNFATEIPGKLDRFLRNEIGKQRLYLTRIDDDDAFRFDVPKLFSRLAISRPESESIFMTTDRCLEFFPVERMVLPIRSELILNVAFGSPESIQGFASQGHTRLRQWAHAKGTEIAELEAAEPVFLYTRHRQASSRFGSRRSHARNHPDSRKWTLEELVNFNVNIDKLGEFRKFASGEPYVGPESLWARSDELLREAAALRTQLDAVKAKILAANSRLLP